MLSFKQSNSLSDFYVGQLVFDKYLTLYYVTDIYSNHINIGSAIHGFPLRQDTGIFSFDEFYSKSLLIPVVQKHHIDFLFDHGFVASAAAVKSNHAYAAGIFELLSNINKFSLEKIRLIQKIIADNYDYQFQKKYMLNHDAYWLFLIYDDLLGAQSIGHYKLGIELMRSHNSFLERALLLADHEGFFKSKAEPLCYTEKIIVFLIKM